MNEEKPSVEESIEVDPGDIKKIDRETEPTSKDAVRLFFIMLSLLFAGVILCYIFSSFLSDNGFEVLFSGVFVIIPVLLAILFSLPALIIGARHRNEKDSYRLFLWIGIVAVALAILEGAIAVARSVMLFM